MPTSFGGNPGLSLIGGIARGLNQRRLEEREERRLAILDRLRVERLRDQRRRTDSILAREERLQESARSRAEAAERRTAIAEAEAEAEAAERARGQAEEAEINRQIRELLQTPELARAVEQGRILTNEGSSQLRLRFLREGFEAEAVDEAFRQVNPDGPIRSEAEEQAREDADPFAGIPRSERDFLDQQARTQVSQLVEQQRNLMFSQGATDPAKVTADALDRVQNAIGEAKQQADLSDPRGAFRVRAMENRLLELREQVSDDVLESQGNILSEEQEASGELPSVEDVTPESTRPSVPGPVDPDRARGVQPLSSGVSRLLNSAGSVPPPQDSASGNNPALNRGVQNLLRR